MSKVRKDTLKLIWFEAAIALYDHKSISAAAKAINVDRTSIGRYIGDLEKWLGFKVFGDRSPPILTLDGSAVLNSGRRIVEYLNGIRRIKRPNPALVAYQEARRRAKK